MTQLTKRKLISGGLRASSVLVAGAVPILPDIETICMGGVISGLGGVGLDVAASYVLPKEKEVKAEEEKAEEAKEA